MIAPSDEEIGISGNNTCEYYYVVLIFIKEVIQPQVPLGLPCYDFTPVMNHTVVTVLLS